MIAEPASGQHGEGRGRLLVALIADDLSGALDSTAPFATLGLSCAVAVSPQDVEAVLATGASVVAVNTASRHLPAPEAVRIVDAVSRRLHLAEPDIVFKKVDSRLKGNVGVETRAVMAATGRVRAVVAPAVPELGRWVKDGCVVGKGVAEPISVRACFEGLQVETPDIADAGALDALARSGSGAAGTLLVGARSLAAALARVTARGAGDAFVCAKPAALIVGSRDPITLGQVNVLREAWPGLVTVEAPGGHVPDAGPVAGLTLFQALPGASDEPEEVVAERFGAGVAAALSGRGVRTVLATGGDTALSVMRALGVKVVHPRGEVLPGIPWSRIAVPGHGDVSLVTKSGGFGAPDALLSILGLEAADARH